MGFLSGAIGAIAPALGSKLGGSLGGILGSGIAGGIGAHSAASLNEQRIDLAREQMDFQERMSNTAYQRAMADMRKAGLNPILSARLGGASTPGGAQPQVLSLPAVQGMSSAMDVMRSTSQTSLQDDQQRKIEQEIRSMKTTQNLTDAQVSQVGQTIRNLKTQMAKLKEETKGISFENVQRQIMSDFYDSAEFARIAKEMGINAGLLKSIFSKFLGKGK